MDPNNNNQPVGINPIQPAAPAPVIPPVQPVVSKKGMRKGIILLIILVILLLGIAAYILFAKYQLGSVQKTTVGTDSSILPSPTAVPTLTPENDLEVNSPEADLLELEDDLNSL